MFHTLQGEGAQSGRAAVFCRFSGCNLWSGREKDRASAVCQFCDTDFIGTDGHGGGKFETAEQLAQAIYRTWQQGTQGNQSGRPYVVFTGGEPMLQLNTLLVKQLQALGFEVAIETNGTLPVAEGVDWVCVSPKQGAELVQTTGNELKVVVPQLGQDLNALSKLNFEHFFVQPKDVPDVTEKQSNMNYACQVCMNNPQWRLSVQTHKIIGLP